MAFMTTAEYFEMEDVAGKDMLVHDQAFKAVELFVRRLEVHTSTMPETASTKDGREDLPARLPVQHPLSRDGEYLPLVKRYKDVL
ncbi:hypothetical protein EDB19DRAFT_1751668, partial [Suillus lakei]